MLRAPGWQSARSEGVAASVGARPLKSEGCCGASCCGGAASAPRQKTVVYITVRERPSMRMALRRVRLRLGGGLLDTRRVERHLVDVNRSVEAEREGDRI